jgi:hypothetical protein
MAGQNSTNEEIVRNWNAAWEKKDWGPVDSLLADNLTFTSSAGDDRAIKGKPVRRQILSIIRHTAAKITL